MRVIRSRRLAPRLSGECVAGMRQVVEVEVRDPDLLTGLPPADCGIEVSAVPRRRSDQDHSGRAR